MPVPKLTRKLSSLAALIEQERSLTGLIGTSEEVEQPVSESDTDDHELQQQETLQPAESPAPELEEAGGDTDTEGGDTDIEYEVEPQAPLITKQKTASIRERSEQGVAPLLRMSRRLMSLKRRGKLHPLVDKTEEFEFTAGDFLTVRGEEDDFYVCRVLEDVPETAKNFQVAWFNRVEENAYEVSFDDICEMMSVITRVSLFEREDCKFSLSKKHIKQTKRLLREALVEERGEVAEEEEVEKEDEEEDENEEEEEEAAEPPAKRTRHSGLKSSTPSPRKGRGGEKKTATPKKHKAATPKKKKEKKPKAEKKDKPRRTGVLVPNPEIELFEKDPTFETRDDLSLMPCKYSIRAVLLNDMDMLKEAIENVTEVHTVHWPRSPNVGMYAIHYALLSGNKEAISLLWNDLENPKTNRCGEPKIQLTSTDTGSYNFYTFGHAVREIYASRGSREGNNAFLHDKKKQCDVSSHVNKFCFKKPVSLETVEFFVDKVTKEAKEDITTFFDDIWMAIRCGNRKTAGYFVSKAIETDGFGFNFLHKEVLLNDNQPLTKFRSQSVKKKPYENKCILPIHAACINPNSKYIKQLLNAVPEHTIPDKDGYKPVHYASACEGPGPLKVLISRGVDPNDLALKGKTPLMIAAKYGRDENIEVLLASEQERRGEPDLGDEEDEEPMPRININAKSKSTKCAIHFAASNGHANAIRILASHGANINTQTGSYRGNVTPLMQGAMKGNLDVVKTCMELGAGADKKGKWNMTALMYAVKNGHSTVAAYLLRLGVNPNAADTSGNTPVHYAAGYGWLHCLKLLIKAGADPNAGNQWKTTPLALAMMKNHVQCADFLLNLENCNVNFQDDKGRSLLSQTIQAFTMDGLLLDRVRYLVEEKGADVGITDIDEWTPLHFLAVSSIYKKDGRVTLNKWLGIPEVENQSAGRNSAAGSENDPEEQDEAASDKEVPDEEASDEEVPDEEASDEEASDEEVPDEEASDEEVPDEEAPDEEEGESSTLEPMDEDKPGDDDDKDSVSSDDSNLNYGECHPYNNIQPPPRLVMSRAEASCTAAEILSKAGADLNAVNVKGETPLMIAVLQNNFPLIRKLIELGAKLSAGKNIEGRQVIHLQAQQKSDVLDLRRYCSGIEEPQLTGTSAEQTVQRDKFLKSLVRRTSKEMLELFIAAGGELSACDAKGLTPLMIVLQTANYEQFELLLEHNASPALGLENTGRNILHMMASDCLSIEMPGLARKIANMLDKSVRHDMGNCVDNSGFTPLLEACEKYVTSSSCLNQTDEKENGAYEFIKILIDEFGADVKSQVGKIKKGDKISRRSSNSFGLTIKRKEGETDDEYGVTGKFSCLHFLVNYEETHPKTKEVTVPCLKMVMGRLAGCHDILNSRDRHGRTPLHLAVHWNRKVAVEALIKGGVDVNLPSENEDNDHLATALIMAAKPCQKLPIVYSLLEANAKPNLVDKNGRTALSHAVTNPPDSNASSMKLVEAILEAGANVNCADMSSRSALHYAVNTTTGGFETLTEIENLLIKYGADTAAKDIGGRIPLHYAFVKIGKIEDSSLSDPISISGLLVEAMAEKGHDMNSLINHQDNNGQTPLHRAAIRGATICCLNLFQKGAHMDAKDKHGNTPFSLAIRHNHNSCAMMFIQMNAPARCDVIYPVTQEQQRQYEKKKKINMWKWKEVRSLQVPKPVIWSAFRGVVERSWQGVAYLMLEVAGLDFIVALRAVLVAGKLDLAWTLLRKQRKDASVQGTDERGRTLLHLLAIHTKTFSDVENKIAVHLLQRGVSPSALDCPGVVALHYAAVKGNKGLCELLLRYNPSTINAGHPNAPPLAVAFDSDLSKRYALIKLLVDAKPKTLDVRYRVEMADEPKEDSTTILIEAAVNNNEQIVFLLLDNGANVNFPKGNGRTVLMELVRANLQDMVKVILHGVADRSKWTTTKTTVNMKAKDNVGKTVIHHCVQNREYGSSENVAMLRLLAKFGAALDEPDNDGHTPLFYARKQGSGVMRNALVELMGEKHVEQETEEPMEHEFAAPFDTFWEGPEPDVDADAAAMLAEAKTGDEEPEYDPTKPPPVDPAANRDKTGEVYMDPDTGIPYDILMTKVDVRFGLYGLNNFYKMQVIHEKGKNLWVLLNRWGRIGDMGQHQRTPFGEPKEAADEFKKIFKSKTGNEWDNKDNFKKMPKKYALVLPERNPEFKRRKAKEILKPFELTKCPPSRLPHELQELMKTITDQEWLRKSIHKLRDFNLDSDYMPFGRLSMDTINKARDVLLQIKDILKGTDRNNLKGSEDKFEEIADLSNTYYMLLPMSNYTYEKIKPMNEESKVNSALEALSTLSDLAFASRVLLAAQYRSKEVNPLDYCYKALGTHVELMDCDSAECQLILEYINNSSELERICTYSLQKQHVESVYRITRGGEGERMASCGIPDGHRLLWHGTRTANVMGILKEGLRIAPPEAPSTGWAFGKGIYTSDSINKALQYTDIRGWNSRKKGFLLLCEVALGKQFEYDNEYKDSIAGAPDGCDSLWRTTLKIPDPSRNVTTPYGAIVPAGCFVTNEPLELKYKDQHKYLFGGDNEYVVYNVAQVQQRYLVVMSDI